ncbi:hypothetical protein PO124_21650 [Bacillus licheniformis]|nr:hypothetical protein [Bacillus licheniformis]
MGISYLFLCYAAIGIAAFLFVFFKVTETKEKSGRDRAGFAGQAPRNHGN